MENKKPHNAILMLPALFFIICLCPTLAAVKQPALGIIAGCIGLLIIAYALITGQLKMFG